MEKMTEPKDVFEDLGVSVRERISDATEPARDEARKLWRDTVSLFKRSPAAALSATAAGGVLAGIFLARAFSPSQSRAEKKIHNWLETAEETWCNLREGMEEGVSALRKTVDRLK